MTWLTLSSCSYYKRLVTTTDNFLDAELFECLHLLRQRILNHSPAASMEAVAADLATLLLREGLWRVYRLGEVLLDGRDSACFSS